MTINSDHDNYLNIDNRDSINNFIQYLDKEIELLQKQTEMPGWTTWAILGAITSVILFLLSDSDLKIINMANISTLLIIGSLILEGLVLLSISLNGTEPRIAPLKRFRISNSFLQSGRFVLFLQFIKYILLFFLCLKLPPPSLFAIKPLALIILAGYVITGAFYLILSYMKIPLQISGSIPNNLLIIGRALLVIIVIVYTYTAIGYINTLVKVDIIILVSDIRFSFLIMVLFYLILFLAKVPDEIPILNVLIRLRRDLSFDRINLATARKQADIAISGLLLSDVVQKEISLILDLYNDVNKVLLSIGQEIQTFTRQLNVGEILLDVAHKETYQSFIAVVDGEFVQADRISDKIHDAITKLEKRISDLQGGPDLIDPDFRFVMNKIINANDESKSILAKIKSDLSTLGSGDIKT